LSLCELENLYLTGLQVVNSAVYFAAFCLGFLFRLTRVELQVVLLLSTRQQFHCCHQFSAIGFSMKMTHSSPVQYWFIHSYRKQVKFLHISEIWFRDNSWVSQSSPGPTFFVSWIFTVVRSRCSYELEETSVYR